MNKLVQISIATLIAASMVGSAVPAGAKVWGDHGRDRQEWRGDNGWDRDHDRGWHGDRDRDRDHDRGWQRGGRHDDHRWRYYGGSYGYDGYNGRWRTGQRYPYWRDSGYYISDYRSYGLPPPRYGYRYYRADNGDIVMAAIAGGVIGLIIGGSLGH